MSEKERERVCVRARVCVRMCVWKKRENNAVVEWSRIRTPLSLHYVKIHARASEKCSTAKRDRRDTVY